MKNQGTLASLTAMKLHALRRGALTLLYKNPRWFFLVALACGMAMVFGVIHAVHTWSMALQGPWADLSAGEQVLKALSLGVTGVAALAVAMRVAKAVGEALEKVSHAQRQEFFELLRQHGYLPSNDRSQRAVHAWEWSLVSSALAPDQIRSQRAAQLNLALPNTAGATLRKERF